MSNRKTGNDFESEFCELLFQHGFWAHNMAQNQAGQPADIIAAKDYEVALFDCKVCSSKGFAISRIEPNQHSAMQLWLERVNAWAFFVLRLPKGDIHIISYMDIKKYVSLGMKYLPLSSVAKYIRFQEWVSIWS